MVTNEIPSTQGMAMASGVFSPVGLHTERATACPLGAALEFVRMRSKVINVLKASFYFRCSSYTIQYVL